ncbi:hypothetical protein K458DRAFT_394629 [Lentithecium fluviatile CBS 122367]|uniref:Uncharacterized protein n=1 Tax=Lentithecium fluviatile CBS 122367 TaxID=1168545 RepID=A0A6G1IKJ2_9PLEO|nr:hypothetical protein K458DRAFT_394629 [Lentithecium fluviatile CBS 122367]
MVDNHFFLAFFEGVVTGWIFTSSALLIYRWYHRKQQLINEEANDPSQPLLKGVTRASNPSGRGSDDEADENAQSLPWGMAIFNDSSNRHIDVETDNPCAPLLGEAAAMDHISNQDGPIETKDTSQPFSGELATVVSRSNRDNDASSIKSNASVITAIQIPTVLKNNGPIVANQVISIVGKIEGQLAEEPYTTVPQGLVARKETETEVKDKG